MMRTTLRSLGLVGLAVFGNQTPGLAQSFTNGSAQIPSSAALATTPPPRTSTSTTSTSTATSTRGSPTAATSATTGPPVDQPGRPAGRHDRRLPRRHQRAAPQRAGHEPRRRLRRHRPRRRRGRLRLQHLDGHAAVEPVLHQPGRPAGRHRGLLRRRDQRALGQPRAQQRLDDALLDPGRARAGDRRLHRLLLRLRLRRPRQRRRPGPGALDLRRGLRRQRPVADLPERRRRLLRGVQPLRSPAHRPDHPQRHPRAVGRRHPAAPPHGHQRHDGRHRGPAARRRPRRHRRRLRPRHPDGRAQLATAHLQQPARAERRRPERVRRCHLRLPRCHDRQRRQLRARVRGHGQRQRPRPLRPELGAGRLQRLHHAERRRRALQCVHDARRVELGRQRGRVVRLRQRRQPRPVRGQLRGQGPAVRERRVPELHPDQRERSRVHPHQQHDRLGRGHVRRRQRRRLRRDGRQRQPELRPQRALDQHHAGRRYVRSARDSPSRPTTRRAPRIPRGSGRGSSTTRRGR